MKKMSDKEIIEIYTMLQFYHDKYLIKHGVILPNLKQGGNYTKDALVLVRLAKGYPDTETLSKRELTDFMGLYFDDIVDVQQARHLSAQKGWCIQSGTRGENIPKGCYKLVSLEIPSPSFISDRRSGVSADNFDSLKKAYDNRCATCGSEEGKPHLYRKGTIVQLQQGHIDPSKDLVPGNIIPQCQVCNRADRNRWVYDKTGRVEEVADTYDGKRVVIKFIKNTSDLVRRELLELLKSLMKK